MSHWRDHPSLKDKFHPEYPDDIQVLVHDGGPRLSEHHPELVWVRVTGSTGAELTGMVLNQPEQVDGVRQGSTIKLIASTGGPAPVMVTDAYLRERPDWIVQPCDRCGFTELLDAPSDLIRKVFPNLPPGSMPEAFTAFCGLCGGTQLVQSKDAEIRADDGEDGIRVGEGPSASQRTRKWWQIWK